MAVRMTLYSVQLPNKPTFYLDSQVQGIVSVEHAARIAATITGTAVDTRNVMAINYNVATDDEINDIFKD